MADLSDGEVSSVVEQRAKEKRRGNILAPRQFIPQLSDDDVTMPKQRDAVNIKLDFI